MTDRLDSAIADAQAAMPEVGEMLDIEAAALGPEASLDILARRLPRAELHCHFEGAIRPSALRRYAQRIGMSVEGSPRPDAPFDYRGWSKFAADLAFAGEVAGHPDVVTDATLDVLAGAVDTGCRHVELMVTLGFHVERGRDPEQLVRGMAAAFATAADLWGITGGIIVELDRAAGPEAGIQVVDTAAGLAGAGLPVLGIGNSGDPLTVPFAALAPAYERARTHGFRLCGHCDLPEDVTAALDIGLDRIDHGFTAVYDETALDQLVARQVPMTICVTSNLVQMPGLYPDGAQHPVVALAAAGANISFHTDDPPYFFTDLAQEYRSAARVLGWGPKEMGDAARRSLHAAWATSSDRVGEWDSEIAALVDDPRLTRPLVR